MRLSEEFCDIFTGDNSILGNKGHVIKILRDAHKHIRKTPKKAKRYDLKM